MRRLLRNTIDLLSLGLVFGGAYLIDEGLAIMLAGALGLVAVWRLDRRDNQ